MFRFRYLMLTFLILTSLFGCISFKKQLANYGSQDQAIMNAIADFSNTSKLYKKDSVFRVTFYDTLYQKALLKVTDRNYKWVNDKPYKKLTAVSIFGSGGKIYFKTDSTEIGSNVNGPSRYVEIDNNLFVWHDDKNPINKETLKFSKNMD